MSDYFRQNLVKANFSSSDSWVILSNIEQRIKAKIEAIGTPLKEWDINIYRGNLTGYNEAFIIDKKKKDELIAEDPKSAEIIRPLLRGRDIKRYSFEFADLYLITTFPSLKIDIELYPAVKQHLLSFGYDRLKQTGDKGSRKKTNNQWFETQDSISYWEDFYRQKIVWKIIGDQMAFFIDNKNLIVNNACYILTGNYLEYLVIILNSKIIKWYSYLTNMNKTGVGDMQVGAQNVVLFPIPILTENEQKPFKALLQKILLAKQNNEDSTELEKLSNNLVYSTYNLIDEEIKFIDQL
ncbi:class I SAM-dependent DNA methyltransferase [Chryseobacterium indologenes]|uniref:TaqI-like C-terminal specificity domain-containing protein n=1 Tax=Chryseobacterium indologenes TaxID=253 RepID=UPI00143EDBFA|nr:TaqI-like C-terminal specificity domain-containing protein [Chryseobacterium indologenes]QIX83241.1 class I SAM-dependent DNA methyltransferase [Chryseobacterium indologenes]